MKNIQNFSFLSICSFPPASRRAMKNYTTSCDSFHSFHLNTGDATDEKEILAVKVSRGRELVAPSITRIIVHPDLRTTSCKGRRKGDRGKECEIGVVEDNAELVTGEISDYYYFLLKRRIDEGRSSPFSFFAVNVKLAHLTSPPGKPWHTPISRAGKTKVRRSPLSIERGNTYSLLKYIQ